MKITDKRPALFEKTSCSIWTDPYIQLQILNEHLNPDSDAASRKKGSILKITDFIVRHTQPHTRLLDLGCGPGLYSSLLQDKGYNVTGVDFNQASIAYAVQQRKDITYLCNDYLLDFPEGSYDAAIMIYCDLGTHSDQERDQLLGTIYRSLYDGGVFIFDIFSEKLVQDKKEERNWEYIPAGGFWSANEYLLLSQTFHYPEHNAFAYQYNLLTENETKHFIVWERYYSENEIITILKKVGFSKVAIYHNIAETNNFTSSNELFIVATK